MIPAMDLYHLLNRGVDKRAIFLNEKDYLRFVSGLELFNDTRSIEKIFRNLKSRKVRLTKSDTQKEALVDIHGWCVMRNHYHLLVSEKVDGGITKFLRKLNIGYSKYFNKNYKRSGTLLQARTKKILIETDAHFLHILNYIHLNPLDYHRDTKKWREGKIENITQSLSYLEKYRWSSYHNYCNKSEFPDITTTSFFTEVFEDYPKQLKKYLESYEIGAIKPYLLE